MINHFDRDDAQHYANLMERTIFFLSDEFVYIATILKFYDPEWKQYDMPMINYRRLFWILVAFVLLVMASSGVLSACAVYVAKSINLLPIMIGASLCVLDWATNIGTYWQSVIVISVPITISYVYRFFSSTITSFKEML